MGAAILELEPNTRLSYRRAIEHGRRAGLTWFTNSTRRSTFEQVKLFLRFKAGLSRFPAARPGTSTHELGIAVDLSPKRGSLPAIVQVMAIFNFKWAGPHDSVHFTFQGGIAAPLVRGTGRRPQRPVRLTDLATTRRGVSAARPFRTLPTCKS